MSTTLVPSVASDIEHFALALPDIIGTPPNEYPNLLTPPSLPSWLIFDDAQVTGYPEYAPYGQASGKHTDGATRNSGMPALTVEFNAIGINRQINGTLNPYGKTAEALFRIMREAYNKYDGHIFLNWYSPRGEAGTPPVPGFYKSLAKMGMIKPFQNGYEGVGYTRLQITFYGLGIPTAYADGEDYTGGEPQPADETGDPYEGGYGYGRAGAGGFGSGGFGG